MSAVLLGPRPAVASADHYIRLKVEVARALAFEHLDSEPSPDVLADAFVELGGAASKAGITEWTARTTSGQNVTMGWDWAEDVSGNVHLVPLVRPRTNLRLIDSKGYDMAWPASTQHLFSIIETLPWRPWVRQALPDPALSSFEPA